MSDTNTKSAVLAELKKLDENAIKVLTSHKAGIDNLTGRVEHLEATADRPRAADDKGSLLSKEHEGLLRYIRSGDQSLLTKDASIGGTDAGGATVPQFLVRRIHERMRDLSPLVSDVLATEPATSSDIKVPVNLRGTGTEWVAETGTRTTQSTPIIKGMVPTHGGCSSVLRLTQWLLQDSVVMLEQYLVDEIAAEITLALETAVISGNGTNKPSGLLKETPVDTADNASPMRGYQVLEYIPSGAASTIPHAPTASPQAHGGDVLHGVVAALRTPYRRNARWLMNRGTLSTVSKWKDADGRYLISAGLEGSRDMLLGYPVVVCDAVASIGTNAFPILFGDFTAGYRLFQINQPIFVRDPYSTPGWVRLYYETRYAGAVADSDAVKVLKVAAS